MYRQRSCVLMHGNSLLAVSLTRAAHPAELSKSAAEDRVSVADRAPADAEVATATVRTATATGTSHRSGKRRGRRNIRPTPFPDLAPPEFGAKRPINHRATRLTALARPLIRQSRDAGTAASRRRNTI